MSRSKLDTLRADAGKAEAAPEAHTDAREIYTDYVSLTNIFRDREQARSLSIDEETLVQDPETISDKRLADEIAGIQSLAASIAKTGLTNPICVIHTRANQFRVISGERRWWAYQYLYKNNHFGATPPRVRVSIYKEDTAPVRRLQLTENYEREDLNLKDLMRAVELAYEEVSNDRSWRKQDPIKNARDFSEALGLRYQDGTVWWKVVGQGRTDLQDAIMSGQLQSIDAVRRAMHAGDAAKSVSSTQTPKPRPFRLQETHLEKLVRFLAERTGADPARILATRSSAKLQAKLEELIEQGLSDNAADEREPE